jgi:hypothetical protein
MFFDLFFEDGCELGSKNSAHVQAFVVNKVNQSYVAVEDWFKKNASFHALNWNLPGDLFYCDVMSYLNKVEGIDLLDFIFECLLTVE